MRNFIEWKLPYLHFSKSFDEILQRQTMGDTRMEFQIKTFCVLALMMVLVGCDGGSKNPDLKEESWKTMTECLPPQTGCDESFKSPDSKEEPVKTMTECLPPETGCDESSNPPDSQDHPGKTGIECLAPQNPFNDNSELDEGFKWAVENGNECVGKSQSFKAGCAEYGRMLKEFNECLATSNSPD